MKNLGNVKQITISDLVEQGMYSQEILKDLLQGKYEVLYKLTITDRSDRDFMEPLFYAVKNTKSTYAVYKYLGQNLQDNIELAEDIIEKEPELLNGTPVSRNREFIKAKIVTHPELVNYMSPEFKNDIEIIEKVHQTGNEQAIKVIEPNEKMIAELTKNPELSGDKTFMMDKISQFGEAIQFASEELKNDYEFLKEAYKANVKENVDKPGELDMTAIDYTAEHTHEFGEKGLLAAKEVVIETTLVKAIQEFESKITEKNKELEKLRANPELPKNDEDIKQAEKESKRLERHKKFIEKIQEGEHDPVRAAKLINKYCAKLDPDYRKRLEQMLIIDTAMKQKQQNGKKQVTQEEIGKVAENFKKMEENPRNELDEMRDGVRNGQGQDVKEQEQE